MAYLMKVERLLACKMIERHLIGREFKREEVEIPEDDVQLMLSLNYF